MLLGELEITALLDGTLLLPLPEMYQNTTPEHAAEVLRAAFRDIPTDTSVNAFLVNDGARLTLIDAGTGVYLGAEAGHLVRNLEASGYRTDQIDHVILTHIHTDHSGGLIRDGKMVFQNATIHLPEREVAFWIESDTAARPANVPATLFAEAQESLRPYLDEERVIVFGDNEEVLPGISSLLRAGHTPGHSSIIVSSGGKKLVFWGDITHGDVLQFDEPEVTIHFDVDHSAAVSSRAAAFAEAADQGYLVAGAHIAFPGIGNVLRDDRNYGWRSINYSDGDGGVFKQG
jgi:glyoxylase-like metal-dependent hydrolase (beta-lactamase superfamily II)